MGSWPETNTRAPERTTGTYHPCGLGGAGNSKPRDFRASRGFMTLKIAAANGKARGRYIEGSMIRKILAGLTCLFLGSCIFSSRSFEPRPSQLNPESDAFAGASL